MPADFRITKSIKFDLAGAWKAEILAFLTGFTRIGPVYWDPTIFLSRFISRPPKDGEEAYIQLYIPAFPTLPASVGFGMSAVIAIRILFEFPLGDPHDAAVPIQRDLKLVPLLTWQIWADVVGAWIIDPAGLNTVILEGVVL
jgi:hypothetical protein